MKKTFIAAALIGTAAFAFAKDNDPVLMTVDGRDVKLSEFEYLYNKNNAQQSQNLGFDEYLGMFVNYKLKVADALAHGIDTTATFVDEYEKYSQELAQPYLRDNDLLESMAHTQYERMPRELYVSHIMIAVDPANEAAGYALADSVRNLVTSGSMTFEDAARQFSIDGGSSQQGGRMSWITSTSHLPQTFIDMAYDTPIGQVSQVVNSGYGLHIIRPEEERPVTGEVNAKHILVMTQGVPDAELPAKKDAIDSIYELAIAPGADFSDIARKYSEDPGSARNGGDLGWFGTGRMVPEFEEVAFSLKDGEISKPFKSAFGWHIIYRVAHRGDTIAPYDQLRPQIMKTLEQTGQTRKAEKAYINALAERIGWKLNPDVEQQALKFMADNGITQVDSTAYDRLLASGIIAYTKPGASESLSSAVKGINMRMTADPKAMARNLGLAAAYAFDKAVLAVGRDELARDNAEYRNLINEYRDGIMLFDRSNQMVWEKATADKAGQEKYFRENIGRYAWDAPRYKAYVIFANSDSVMQAAKEYIATLNPSKVKSDMVSTLLKNKFGKNIKVEKVIAAKGENPITDFLGFGQARPKPNSRWAYYFAYDGKVIDAPEGPDDVRGRLITDYQNYLEKEWIDQLHKQYKVKINNKTANQARKKIDGK